MGKGVQKVFKGVWRENMENISKWRMNGMAKWMWNEKVVVLCLMNAHGIMISKVF